MLFSLVLVTSLIGSVFAFNCSIPPVYVDIHKRAVHGTNDFEYGMFMGLGTPAQNQSLWLSLSSNETSVADVNFCQQGNITDCPDGTGGFFEPGLSTTWVPINTSTVQVTDGQENDNGYFGTETFHLYEHYFDPSPAWMTSVNNLTIRVATNGSDTPGKVGFGLNSGLLNSLYAQGLIASRSFAFYVGSGLERAGGVVNGSTTFGGYDAARFTGPVHNYTIDTTTPNPFNVQVSNIIISGVNGAASNISLLDRTAFPTLPSSFSTGFRAAITTDQYPLSLPYSMTQNFITTLAALPSTNADNSLQISRPFNGTMTIVLSDGFSVTLPSDVVYNASGLSPVAARDEDDDSPFLLSTAWLSQVYFMADYDDGKFHLAQAVPEAPFITTQSKCPNVVPVPYQRSATTFGGAGLIGAVLGGVIGGSAICTLLICVFLERRKHKRRVAVDRALVGKMEPKMAQFEIDEGGSQTSGEVRKGVGSGWFVDRLRGR
ncbi:MAG: hypothetical protein M1827_000222 [Pycnora praestabilis]|nr:MAG: hypothetical protein M1827_000222 [Pycnora praestabilis]